MRRLHERMHLLAAIVILSMVLAACSDDSEDGASGTTGGDQQQVAFVAIGPVNDKGFTQSVYEAAKDESESLGYKFSYTDQVPDAQLLETFRGYARRGYDLILCAGEECTQAQIEAGKEYPDADFAAINGAEAAPPNVASVQIDQWPLGYLAGVMAASASETGVIGNVQAVELTSTQRISDGYAAGAASIDPDIEILKTFTGDFSDPEKGKEAALAMIESDADVLVSALDLGVPGIIEAAKQSPGVHVIGFFTDQAVAFGEEDLYLTSAIASWPEATRETVRIFSEGEFEGQMYVFSVQDPRFAYLAPFGPAVSAEAADAVNAALEQFRSGELTAPEG